MGKFVPESVFRQFREIGLFPVNSLEFSFLGVHRAMGCSVKSFTPVWWCQQLLSGFLAKCHLPRVSRLSANYKCDNYMIPGTVHRSPNIFLTAEKNLSKETVDESCTTNHRLRMRSIGSHSTSGMEKKGKDGVESI